MVALKSRMCGLLALVVLMAVSFAGCRGFPHVGDIEDIGGITLGDDDDSSPDVLFECDDIETKQDRGLPGSDLESPSAESRKECAERCYKNGPANGGPCGAAVYNTVTKVCRYRAATYDEKYAVGNSDQWVVHCSTGTSTG